ncbi:leucine-rich repeat flightless-interacting protein 1 isoform X2 [Epinephelus moara]|uniref:leucine-rich repeat flightless-interacting protein 1 isoform X2 n=1 Tax=Epinephelus moara TaxID=300413 RepID=UPI00214E929D|nr:leucine-rich repeat flightless-interacting protein 1 isoform X2 [Epinephelus moara]
MGTQGPGRKRIPNREKLTAEDDALNQIAREAEARLAAKRAARAEAREIRMKELERQQKELFHSHKEDSERYSRHSRRHASMSDDEERMSVGSRGSLRPSAPHSYSYRVEERTDRDRDLLDKGSRTASTLSAATLASLGGASSRRGSCDTSFSVETEASIRDMKESLAESEEKYRKAMVSNAQLHNEKSTLMYQVETLREELSDMEELLWESRRHYDDRTKELERERHAHRVLQFQFKDMEDTLRQTEELLTEVSDLRLKSSSYCQEVSDLQEVLQWKEKKMATHGIVLSPEVSTNGEAGQGEVEDDVSTDSASRLAQEPSPGGRESMLGKVPEWHPAEGEEEPVQNSVAVHAKTPNDTSEHPERNDQRETPKMSAPLVSAEMLKEWSCLEKKIQSMLKGFVENRAFSAEISRIFPDVPESLHRFILDFEETLKNATEDVSDLLDTTGQMMGPGLTAEGELPLKDFPEDPKSMEQSPAGRPMISKDCSVSSLEVHPQTYDVLMDPRKDCEDDEEPPASDDKEATENISGLTSGVCKRQEEVTDLSQEEMPGMNAVDVEEARQGRSERTSTRWLEDFVFVELYFAKPANMVETGPNQGLVDLSTNPQGVSCVDNEVCAKTNKQRGTNRGSQSCIVPAEDAVETRLKRHRALSLNSQSSKVRRLIEMAADEFKTMAVPELVPMSTQEGRVYDESTRSNSEDQNELSVGDIDSCEEVYEEPVQQPAAQQRHPVREVVVEDGKVAPGARSGRKGFSLDNRKNKHKTDCKIS